MAASAGPDRLTTGTVAREASRRDLLAVVAGSGKPYYDEASDLTARASYYASVDANLAPAALFDELHELVSSTHTTWLDYDAAKHLYPWVDLRPSLRLQSIYSAQSVATDDPVRRPTDSPKLFKRSRSGMERLNAKMNRRAEVFRQAEDWIRALSSAPTDAATLASRIALVEAANYFNCEHAVPQVLFDRQDPMRGDLHHLFTAERDINAVRSNRPLADYPEYDGKPIEGAEPEGFAPADRAGFEPAGGKGPMARAVLYFMVRYPWVLERQAGRVMTTPSSRLCAAGVGKIHPGCMRSIATPRSRLRRAIAILSWTTPSGWIGSTSRLPW